MLRLTERILSFENFNSAVIDFIKQSLNNFYERHKSSIINYENWKLNCEKEEYLKAPEYKLYEIKNRNTSESIIANVKWKFLYEGNYLEDKSISVYLGNKNNFPEGKFDENIPKIATEKIRHFFLEKSPLDIIDTKDLSSMKYEVELYEYWKEKLKELEYRLSPIYYLSQSKKDQSDKVIINIKWGFNIPNKEKAPRYLLKRYTLKQKSIENYQKEDLDREIRQVISQFLDKNHPVFINIPKNK